MAELFITSDTHFGHANIIKYTGRPFKDVYHMDTELIRRWNERVAPEDTVIHLGDFCFKNSPGGKEGEGTVNPARHYTDQLNGKIIPIKGNHDKNNSFNTHITGLEISFGKYLFWATHRPDDCDFAYKINLVGHVHDKWQYRTYWNTSNMKNILLINVGVDQHNFYPLKMTQVLQLIARIKRNDK
jgi:calcineurin-like phosphoesterase family protein